MKKLLSSMAAISLPRFCGLKNRLKCRYRQIFMLQNSLLKLREAHYGLGLVGGAVLTVLIVMVLLPAPGFAQSGGLPAFNVTSGAEGEQTYSLSLQILALMSGLAILPSLLLGMTAFTRIIIVLSIMRQALGTQQTPPNQVLISIALFLTIYIMTPTFQVIYDTAVSPYLDGNMDPLTAIEVGGNILREFIILNTREAELAMFAEMAGDAPYEDNDDVPYTVLMPAFITSELKTAFQIGFLIFLPFLVIDLVIASILMALGMMMLSPMIISLPFKLLLFVLVDGWAVMIGSLAATYVM
ncbi:MAG: flagellar type III secretion system pore protein FliP [Marinovum sp.]|nr:flagellar type III secretion system pore protein FliP [Marinovum sp.]